MDGAKEESAMNVELVVAGVSCAVLALGHTAIGQRWALPGLARGRLPGSPFGPPAMTLGMLRFTWHIVTVMLLAFSSLLMILAWTADANPRTLLLRWLAAFWLVATAMALWNARRRPSTLLRLPVPVLFMVIAVMCWIAST
jgi:hypothetical protein